MAIPSPGKERSGVVPSLVSHRVRAAHLLDATAPRTGWHDRPVSHRRRSTTTVTAAMGSLIKKRRKRMRKKKHKKMLKRTRFQRRAKGK